MDQPHSPPGVPLETALCPDPPGAGSLADRRRRLLRAGLLSLVLGVTLLVAGLLLTVVLLGAVPGLSALAGSSEPRDLGVRYGDQDARSGREKLTVPPGTAALDASLTEAEVTALANQQAALMDAPLRRIQVALAAGGAFELSALARAGGRELPVYGRGAASFAGGRLEEVDLTETTVGVLPMPGALRDRVERALADMVEEALVGSPQFHLEGLETGAGTVRVTGTVQP